MLCCGICTRLASLLMLKGTAARPQCDLKFPGAKPLNEAGHNRKHLAAERAEALRRKRASTEHAERAERERISQARAEQERAKQERAEQERVERERAERERAERERAERVRAERERAERVRALREDVERQRIKLERAEQGRAEREKERAERDRALREDVERQRIKLARAEQERAKRITARKEAVWRGGTCQHSANRGERCMFAVLRARCCDWSDVKAVKKAYHKLMLHMHPDKGGSIEACQTVTAAYKMYSDSIHRIPMGLRMCKCWSERTAFKTTGTP
ncbi:hypothetical protein JKP88DRAFT_254516 [Tribonema minus]|uniref:J domain-containing protein n=1 Tax=Tribonema minus TaxID=303371 RepID=A0A835Z518_9STRA|nr:hypothetical protein JKP88DRAFT_254516 [Tribonema minus]